MLTLQVYRDASDETCRYEPSRFCRLGAAAASAAALGGSSPTLIEASSSTGHVSDIGERLARDITGTPPSLRPASPQSGSAALGSCRGRWFAAAGRSATTAGRLPLSATTSVGSPSSPNLGSSARKVWRAAHQRRADSERPAGTGSSGVTGRPLRDASLETTAGGDTEESRVIR